MVRKLRPATPSATWPTIFRSEMTPTEIITCLRALSGKMIQTGTAMVYFGGFNVIMVQRGRELVGAGLVVHEWAKEIEEKE